MSNESQSLRRFTLEQFLRLLIFGLPLALFALYGQQLRDAIGSKTSQVVTTQTQRFDLARRLHLETQEAKLQLEAFSFLSSPITPDLNALKLVLDEATFFAVGFENPKLRSIIGIVEEQVRSIEAQFERYNDSTKYTEEYGYVYEPGHSGSQGNFRELLADNRQDATQLATRYEIDIYALSINLGGLYQSMIDPAYKTQLLVMMYEDMREQGYYWHNDLQPDFPLRWDRFYRFVIHDKYREELLAIPGDGGWPNRHP